jgi:hypothetical protein
MDRPLRLISTNPVDQLARVVEALLVVATAPLAVDDLAHAADDDPDRIETALGLLSERYREGRSGIVLERVAGGYAFRAAREAADAYAADLRLRQSVPDIVAIRRHAERVRTAALARARRRLGRLTEGELEAVERLTRSIVRQLLHQPTVALRRTAAAGSRSDQLRAAIVAALTDQSDPEENHGLPT